MYLGHDQKYPFNKLCRGSVKKLKKNLLQTEYFISDHSLNIHSISLFWQVSGFELRASFLEPSIVERFPRKVGERDAAVQNL